MNESDHDKHMGGYYDFLPVHLIRQQSNQCIHINSLPQFPLKIVTFSMQCITSGEGNDRAAINCETIAHSLGSLKIYRSLKRKHSPFSLQLGSSEASGSKSGRSWSSWWLEISCEWLGTEKRRASVKKKWNNGRKDGSAACHQAKPGGGADQPPLRWTEAGEISRVGEVGRKAGPERFKYFSFIFNY